MHLRAVFARCSAAVISAALALILAGCGGEQHEPGPTDGGTAAAAPVAAPGLVRRLDGLYGAELDGGMLRRATRSIRPAVRVPGGWWTMRLDIRGAVLTLSHPGIGDGSFRIVRVTPSRIVLAPDLSCEQRGAARLEPASLAWFRTGSQLRLTAISVPCLTTRVLLTGGVWRHT